MWTHKIKLSIIWLQIFVLMKFRLLNTCSSSIEPNTWIMAICVSFTYYEMLQDKTIEWKMIPNILVKGLIVLAGPKATLALLFIVILNMDFCTSTLDAHNTLRTACSTTPIFFGVEKKAFKTFRWVLNYSS